MYGFDSDALFSLSNNKTLAWVHKFETGMSRVIGEITLNCSLDRLYFGKIYIVLNYLLCKEIQITAILLVDFESIIITQNSLRDFYN